MTTNGGTDIKTDTQTVRVAIYARESSDLQVDGQKVEPGSLDSQVSEAMAFAERVPYYTVVEVYVDQGQLAGPEEADRRPEFRRMMDDAKAGRFDVLVTTSVDRLSLNVVNLLETVRELHEYGVTYRSIRENLDFGGPMGEFMLAQLGAFAQMQSSMLLAQMNERGLPLSSWWSEKVPPHGKRLDEINATVMREKRRERGMSRRELSELLGVSPKTLAEWEAGTQRPHSAELVKLREWLEGEVTVTPLAPLQPLSDLTASAFAQEG